MDKNKRLTIATSLTLVLLAGCTAAPNESQDDGDKQLATAVRTMPEIDAVVKTVNGQIRNNTVPAELTAGVPYQGPSDSGTASKNGLSRFFGYIGNVANGNQGEYNTYIKNLKSLVKPLQKRASEIKVNSEPIKSPELKTAVRNLLDHEKWDAFARALESDHGGIATAFKPINDGLRTIFYASASAANEDDMGKVFGTIAAVDDCVCNTTVADGPPATNTIPKALTTADNAILSDASEVPAGQAYTITRTPTDKSKPQGSQIEGGVNTLLAAKARAKNVGADVLPAEDEITDPTKCPKSTPPISEDGLAPVGGGTAITK